MPVIVRLRHCVIAMYLEDHKPPHFHVRGDDGREAEVRLGTLEVLKGDAGRRAMAEALAWAAANADLLRETWDEFHRR